MSTGFRDAAGIDLQERFQAGTVQVAGFRDSAGNNLQFAARGAAAKIPDVGFRDASGTDVSNIWLGASTAPPVTDGGLPVSLTSYVALPSGGGITAVCSFVFAPSGAVGWQYAAGSGSGTWLGTGSAGDYDIRFTDLGSTGGLSGVTGAWLQLSSDREVTLTAFLPPGVALEQRSQTAAVRIEIRRRSDLVVLLNRDIALTSVAERTL